MQYHVSRNGQTYGPYTLEDLQRYVASGNVLLTDMAKSEEMAEWQPVAQILGAQAAPGTVEGPAPGEAAAAFSTPSYADPAYTNVAQPGGYAAPAGYAAGYAGAALAASTYPDPPSLSWGLVLLFCVLTCGLFMTIWNLVVAAWLRKVQPNATSLYYYLGAVVLFVVQILAGGAANMQAIMHPAVGGGMSHVNPIGSFVALLTWVVRLVARFSQRASLEEHFNGPEPVGLQLNPVMTFFFGGLYFQAKLNEITAMKTAARLGAGRAY